MKTKRNYPLIVKMRAHSPFAKIGGFGGFEVVQVSINNRLDKPVTDISIQFAFTSQRKNKIGPSFWFLRPNNFLTSTYVRETLGGLFVEERHNVEPSTIKRFSLPKLPLYGRVKSIKVISIKGEVDGRPFHQELSKAPAHYAFDSVRKKKRACAPGPFAGKCVVLASKPFVFILKPVVGGLYKHAVCPAVRVGQRILFTPLYTGLTYVHKNYISPVKVKMRRLYVDGTAYPTRKSEKSSPKSPCNKSANTEGPPPSP